MWTCAYRNDSPRMVILRCLGGEGFFQEKVLFPFELWSFDCPPDSDVEVWSHGTAGAELVANHGAAELRVADGSEGGIDPVALGFAGLVMAPEWVSLPGQAPLGSNGWVAGPGASMAPVGMH
ncbi:MAG: DUF1830 domain-containing protein [Cyanobacteriota bacterium]|nr:DUF1830 domain-containing protein [Cyanobacteriota bacterium]